MGQIGFHLNGVAVQVAAGLHPATSLLHWLRGEAGLTGTKEGCAEGDCGACTVVLEQPDGTRTPINACLAALGQLHGARLRTVEGLRGTDGAPHPVQRALADGNATQCGFCTPGFVMAAWAHAQTGGDVHEALAGNLCRCTGYRPIVDAVAALAPERPAPHPPPPPAGARFDGEGASFLRPGSMAELLAWRAARPDATVLAGGTDLGLLWAEGRDRPAAVLCTLGVPELQAMAAEPGGLRVGAAVSYERLLGLVRTRPTFAPLVPLLGRLGSRQIRGLGTLGGNLGTASPIGDMLPPLLALGATVRLRSQAGARELAVAAFLLGYRRTALGPDEVIESVFIPEPAGAVFVCEKLSKRYDQDISTVSAAFLLRLEAGRVRDARLAFGGMGATAVRAPAAEAALTGADWSQGALDRAAAALELAPIGDLRGTAAHRQEAAAGMLRRLWWRVERPELALEVHAL